MTESKNMEKEAINRIISEVVGFEADFYSDLNAIHKAEKTLCFDELNHYADILCDMVAEGEPDPNICGLVTLTAAQRSRAFVKVHGNEG